MTTNQPADNFFVVATVLPIKQWRHVWPFLMLTRQVQKQLATSTGLIHYRLKANVFAKRFWTLSVWADKDAVRLFVRSGTHAKAVKLFQDWAAPGAAFVEWNSQTPQVSWQEALGRLKTPTFTYDV